MEKNKGHWGDETYHILTIAMCVPLYAFLWAYGFWLIPAFEYFDKAGMLDQSAIFHSLSRNDQSILFYRLVSMILSIPVCLICLYFSDRTSDKTRGKTPGPYGFIMRIFVLNATLSIAYNWAFLDGFPSNSYISNFNFVTTYLVFFCITGPIIEELTFRVSLFSLIRRRSSFWVANITSSVVFGVIHIGNGQYFVLVSTLWAIFWGYSYEKTQRPFFPIALHAANNFVASMFFIFAKH